LGNHVTTFVAVGHLPSLSSSKALAMGHRRMESKSNKMV